VATVSKSSKSCVLPWNELPAVLVQRLKAADCCSVSDWRRRGRKIFGIPPKLSALVDAAIAAMPKRAKS